MCNPISTGTMISYWRVEKMVVKYGSSKEPTEINLQLLINRLSEEQLQPMSHKKIITVLLEIIQEGETPITEAPA